MKIIQIKNKPLRIFVSAIALLTMIAVGVAALGAACYGVGQISFLSQPDDTIPMIFLAGFVTLLVAVLIGVLVCIIGYSFYEGVKKLANGPFDP